MMQCGSLSPPQAGPSYWGSTPCRPPGPAAPPPTRGPPPCLWPACSPPGQLTHGTACTGGGAEGLAHHGGDRAPPSGKEELEELMGAVARACAHNPTSPLQMCSGPLTLPCPSGLAAPRPYLSHSMPAPAMCALQHGDSNRHHRPHAAVATKRGTERGLHSSSVLCSPRFQAAGVLSVTWGSNTFCPSLMESGDRLTRITALSSFPTPAGLNCTAWL